MSSLPLPFTTQTYPGSQWLTVFQFLNSDGSLMPIDGYSYQMVVRTSTESSGSPVFSVASSGATSYGSITIDLTTSSITVTLTPTATLLLLSGAGGEPYALTLWQDPGLSTASVVVSGSIYAIPVASPV